MFQSAATSAPNPSMSQSSTMSTLSAASMSQSSFMSNPYPATMSQSPGISTGTMAFSSAGPFSSNSMQRTLYTTQPEISSQYVQSVTSQSVTTEVVITLLRNYYIDFTLTGNFDFNQNETLNETALSLLEILLQCFPTAVAQQIQITFRLGRTLGSAQIRFFSTVSMSAETLYQSLGQELDNASSEFRNNTLTSQLTRDSIVEMTTTYYCANNVTQTSPCDSSTDDKLSLATVIAPSVIGGVLLFGGILLLFAFAWRRSRSRSRFRF
jgi:hypothetical protein